MRIISGIYARREIEVVGRTRPPLLRIRQSIFDIQCNDWSFEGKTVLDLCAGSGSLGLEALSRGASFAFFFEENFKTASNLMNTIKKWQISNAKVICRNVNYLPEAKIQADLIFFDPPFGHNYIPYVLSRLVEKQWCHDNTKLIVRVDHEIHYDELWVARRVEKIGLSLVYFYERKICEV